MTVDPLIYLRIMKYIRINVLNPISTFLWCLWLDVVLRIDVKAMIDIKAK